VIRHQDNDWLFFGGTSYLGIHVNEEFKNLVIEGAMKYGFSSGISRINNVRSEIYAQAEEYAARYFGAEDAILLSSGYLAAQLAVNGFAADRWQLNGTGSHPALFKGQPGSTITIPGIPGYIAASSGDKWLICSNSVNNLYPEFYGLHYLEYVDKDAILVVDDSHGIGITGNEGKGVYSSLKALSKLQPVVVASMAKALGIDAGIILGDAEQMDYLRKSALYAGASPPSPAMLYAFIHAAHIYTASHARLEENVRYFNALLQDKKGIHFIDGFPVYHLADTDAAQKLYDQQVLISSFPYPDPNGLPLNRIVVNALHTRADLEKLASLL
jgi:7-keto-8-aminopelargonate synthetase-like enzyme